MQDFSAPPMPEQADSNGIQDLSRGILSFRDSQLRDLDQLSACTIFILTRANPKHRYRAAL